MFYLIFSQKVIQDYIINSLIIGVMRSGKSTLLKKQFLQRAILGDFVRAFDITGEFTELTNTLGGKIIACDGTNGIQIHLKS